MLLAALGKASCKFNLSEVEVHFLGFSFSWHQQGFYSFEKEQYDKQHFMKRFFLLACFASFAFMASAQAKNPVAWKFEAKKKDATTYEVVITATIDKPWHIYSQNTGAGGPIPTKFTFKPNPLLAITGKVTEKGKLEKIYDKNFKVDVLYYSNSVVFTQIVKLKNANAKSSITGTVEYMVCDDEQCLPPKKQSFDIKL